MMNESVKKLLKAKSADNTGCCKGERRQWRKQRTEAGAAIAECEGFCPRSTMRVPQPDIIEHFGNADAVPQLPEHCYPSPQGGNCAVLPCPIFVHAGLRQLLLKKYPHMQQIAKAGGSL